jgi:hypothetical protein
MRQAIVAAKGKPEPENERVVLPNDLSGTTLRREFEGKTSLEGQRAVQPYLGKWLYISGRVFNVDFDAHIGWNVAIHDDAPSELTSLYFADSEGPKIETLRLNTNVRVLGQIKSIDRYSIRLEHCTLVEPSAGSS